ncbi:MAG: hypothetical protein ABJH04_06850 [Cyclobacteriaceae bacterium]
MLATKPIYWLLATGNRSTDHRLLATGNWQPATDYSPPFIS